MRSALATLFGLVAVQTASAVPAGVSNSILSSLRSDLDSLRRGVWEDDGDRLVQVGRTGDPGEVCHACHYSSRAMGCNQGSQVQGVCGSPSSCSGDRMVGGHCNGGSDNVCCRSSGEQQAPVINNEDQQGQGQDQEEQGGDQQQAPTAEPGQPNGACLRGQPGICGNPGSCSGNLVSGHCSGGSDNVCCAPIGSGNNNNGGGGNLPAPASPGSLSAPYPQTSGSPGELNGPCLQGQRGVCVPESQCETNNGYRVQRGRCKGSNYCCTPRNAGTNDDIIPEKFFQPGALCYPVSRASLSGTAGDFGNGRPRSSNSKRNKRCHAGQDIFTKSPGKVFAIDDGVVTHISNTFLKCRSGWGIRQFYGGRPTYGGAIYIYHPSIDRTINYGEADGDQNKVRVGQTVSKGQLITRASVCGMLHFEVYKGRRSSNVRWWGSRACRDAAARGRPYSCPTPPNAAENNYCAKYAMDVKEPETIDPRAYLELIANNFCE